MSASGRLWRILAATAAAVTLATMLTVVPAAAAGPAGTGVFGLTPAPNGHGQVAPYFMMAMAADESATVTALISNPSNVTETLKVSRSTGVTASNGGSAFSGAFQPCSRTGCWVTVTPAVVTLRPGTGRLLTVSVHVPAGTAPGQYLAGVTAASTARPRSVRVGAHGKAVARAIIIEQVSVGVAVTVGNLSQLVTRLRIPGVSGAAVGDMARLYIRLRNIGQTFAGATGRVSCTADGRPHSFSVTAGTVLTDDSAQIPVNAPGLPQGSTVPCLVRLRYGHGQTASWTGPVTLPGAPRIRIVHTGPGAYSAVPAGDSVLPWLIGLLAVGILILAALATLLRRRRLGQANPRGAGP